MPINTLSARLRELMARLADIRENGPMEWEDAWDADCAKFIRDHGADLLRIVEGRESDAARGPAMPSGKE